MTKPSYITVKEQSNQLLSLMMLQKTAYQFRKEMSL